MQRLQQCKYYFLHTQTTNIKRTTPLLYIYIKTHHIATHRTCHMHFVHNNVCSHWMTQHNSMCTSLAISYRRPSIDVPKSMGIPETYFVINLWYRQSLTWLSDPVKIATLFVFPRQRHAAMIGTRTDCL